VLRGAEEVSLLPEGQNIQLWILRSNCHANLAPLTQLPLLKVKFCSHGHYIVLPPQLLQYIKKP